jgi:hypothetical protein
VYADPPALLPESNDISSTPPRSLLSRTLRLRLVKSIKTSPKPTTNVFKNAYLPSSTAKPLFRGGLTLTLLDLNKAEIKLCRKAFCTEYKQKTTA